MQTSKILESQTAVLRNFSAVEEKDAAYYRGLQSNPLKNSPLTLQKSVFFEMIHALW